MTYSPYQYGPREGYTVVDFLPDGYQRAVTTFPRSVYQAYGYPMRTMSGSMVLDSPQVVPNQSALSEMRVISPTARARAIAAGYLPPINVPQSWGPYPLSDGPPAYPAHYNPMPLAMGQSAPLDLGDGLVFAFVVGLHGQVVRLVAGGMTPESALETALDMLAAEAAQGTMTADEAAQTEAALRRVYDEIGFSEISEFTADPDGNPATAGRIIEIFNEVSEAPIERKERSGLSTALLLIAGAITAFALSQG
jgi:hypothetical protein